MSCTSCRKPIGDGIRDGRGYGPYGMGYYSSGGCFPQPLPYGPAGEKLGPEYDYTPGPNGSFLPPGAPRKVLAGHLGHTTLGPRGRHRQLGLTEGQRTGVVVGGLLLAAAGLAYAFRPRPARRRQRRRYARRYMTI